MRKFLPLVLAAGMLLPMFPQDADAGQRRKVVVRGGCGPVYHHQYRHTGYYHRYHHRPYRYHSYPRYYTRPSVGVSLNFGRSYYPGYYRGYGSGYHRSSFYGSGYGLGYWGY